MKFELTLKILLFSALFLSSCKTVLIYPAPTLDLSTPPVEDEISMPLMETSVEEILNESASPSGVCVINEIPDVLNCFDINGDLISSLQVPGIGSADPQGLHIAGAVGSATIPPVVYYSLAAEQSLLHIEKGNALPLRKTNTFLAMAGVPEHPILAFSDLVFDDSIPHSFLYAGSLQTLSSSKPFFEMIDTKMGMALMPIAVEAAGSQAGKVWYTHSAWEISGEDRVFPINSGLYVFDLKTGQVSQVLGAERNFQGLSPDKSQAGSISLDIKGDHFMRVTDLLTGQTTIFPLDPTSSRGAGYAVFSIDGKYAAWLEASGSLLAEPPNFQVLIRIGDIENGSVDQKIDPSAVSQVLNWKKVSFIRPVGWLNPQVLVIEVHGNKPNTKALIKYDITIGNPQILCQGSFAGFSYQ